MPGGRIGRKKSRINEKEINIINIIGVLGTIIMVIIMLAGATLCPAQEEVSPEVGAILKRAFQFKERGQFKDAFKVLNDALVKYKEPTFDRYALLNLKFEGLANLSKYQEAVEVAVEKANIVTSPRQALPVVGVYLKLKDYEKALEWLEISVDRGLQTYTIFDEDIYQPLQNNARFKILADTVKKKNGLGLPAKPFIGRAISGHEVSLDTYKGKVLLIDFWATWCLPCMAEMPNMIKRYNEFKDKGFEIVGLALESAIKTLTDYLKAKSIEWPMVTNDKGDFDAVSTIYAVKNIPASFLIDKKGVLRFVNLTGDKFREAIAQLIDG